MVPRLEGGHDGTSGGSEESQPETVDGSAR